MYWLRVSVGIRALGFGIGIGIASSAVGELQRTELIAAADITIVEGVDSQYAADHSGSASTMEVGTMNRGNSFAARRALLQFDLSAIPADATVELALISLRASFSDRAGADPGQSPLLAAYRVLRPWDEAAGSAATWGHAQFNQSRWSEPGANGEQDRAIAPTDFINPFLSGPFHTLDVTPDVRDFINDNADNYGWVLIGAEGVEARYFVRFNTKERDVDDEEKPRLIIYWKPKVGA